VFENGEIADEHFFDIPDWEETEDDEVWQLKKETEDDEVWQLKKDFIGPEREVYKAGYYAYASLHEFLGTEWKEIAQGNY